MMHGRLSGWPMFNGSVAQLSSATNLREAPPCVAPLLDRVDTRQHRHRW
jgi:hypothetical protein